MVPDSFPSLLERYKARRAHELELNRATSAFERAVFQPLFLLNGGASVAVLGLLGAWGARITAAGIKAVYVGLFCWSVGLVLATVATLFGYFSQRDFTRAEHKKRKNLEEKLPKYVTEMPAPPGSPPALSPQDQNLPPLGVPSGLSPQDPNLPITGGVDAPNPKPPTPDELVASAKKHQLQWWRLVALSLVFFILGVAATAYGLAQTAPQSFEPPKAPGLVTYAPPPSPDTDALKLLLEQASRTAPWVTPFFLLAGLGAVCGLLMALRGAGEVRAVGTALTLASIFGGMGVTFFKDVQVKLPTISLASAPASNAQLERMTPIGPFAVGKANVLEPPAVSAVVAPDGAVKNVMEKAKGREVAYVLFIGSADKFELLPQLQTQYGSNIGLARARAEWVEQEVRRAWKGQTFESITLTVGPSMHGVGLSSQDTAGDRSVAIYVAWRERRDEGGIRDWVKSPSTTDEPLRRK